MFRKYLALVTVIVAVGLVGLLGLASVAAQSPTPSATRSFDTTSVAPGGEVTVTIRASNYGAQGGGITETLPAGFAYVSSSLDASQVRDMGQTVRFILQDETSFTYKVTASSTPGSHTFEGMLRDSIGPSNHAIGGASSVTVTTASTPTAAPSPSPSPSPSPTPGGPSASRSISPSSVEAGGEVTVTIRATNYGAQGGGITETLPAGFAYVSSSLDASQVRDMGQTVRFILRDETSFTYKVTAGTAGSHTFSGTLRDSIGPSDHPVGGASSVTVTAPAGGPSASRSISPSSVVAGGEVTVTIRATNYGAQGGGITETLPTGFAYVSSSLDASQVRHTPGQPTTVRFILRDETSFTYKVTAGTAGSHTFTGTLRDSIDKSDHAVGGASSVTVTAPAGGPSASRSISPSRVEAGGEVTVTIRATNYGAQGGGITETLPTGFTYVSSSLDDSQVRHTPGQPTTVRFILRDETSFTYKVTAGTAGSHTFSGTLRDSIRRSDHPVSGASSVTVTAPPGGPRAVRSFSRPWTPPGGTVTVTIRATNYGAQGGGITETLPAGFTYVSSSLDDSQVRHAAGEQTVRFILRDETTFTYTVTAPSTVASHSFSGMLRDSVDRTDHAVSGASSLRVGAPPPTPTPTATPVPQPTATPAPAPTATPVPPAPTATPVPPTATPVPTATPTATATPVPPAPTATPAPRPTATPTATATPVPPAPAATATPVPTATPTPTATPVPTAPPVVPEDEGGIPIWVIVLVVLGLAAVVVVGGIAMRSRQR